MGSLFYHGRALGTVYPDISIRLHNFIKYTSAVTVSPVLLTKLSVTENQLCFFFLFISVYLPICPMLCLYSSVRSECCKFIPRCLRCEDKAAAEKRLENSILQQKVY